MPSVLIAEDDLDTRNILSEILIAHGYAVFIAQDGEVAIEMLEALKPDVLLTDIDMPVLDGLTLCSKVKSNPGTCDVPVILLSGRLPMYQPEGVFDVVQKPVLIDELLKSLANAIRLSNNNKSDT